MNQPKIYFYRNRKLSKINEDYESNISFYRRYSRYYDEERQVESVEREVARGRRITKRTFIPVNDLYIARVEENMQILHLLADKRTDKLLVELIKGEDARTSLRKYGGKKRIIVRDGLKR